MCCTRAIMSTLGNFALFPCVIEKENSRQLSTTRASVPDASYIHSSSTCDASYAQSSPTADPDSANTKSCAQTAQSIIILFKYKSFLEPPAMCERVLHASYVPILSTCEAPRFLGTLTMTYDNDIHTQTGAQRTDNEPQDRDVRDASAHNTA